MSKATYMGYAPVQHHKRCPATRHGYVFSLQREWWDDDTGPMRVWLRENLGPQEDNSRWMDMGAYMVVYDQVDATAFRMRWC